MFTFTSESVKNYEYENEMWCFLHFRWSKHAKTMNGFLSKTKDSYLSFQWPSKRKLVVYIIIWDYDIKIIYHIHLISGDEMNIVC